MANGRGKRGSGPAGLAGPPKQAGVRGRTGPCGAGRGVSARVRTGVGPQWRVWAKGRFRAGWAAWLGGLWPGLS